MFCQGSERGWWRSPEMVCTQRDGFHPCQSRGPKMRVLFPFPVLSGRSVPMGSPQATVSSSAQKYKASPQLPHRAVGGSNEPGQKAVCENVRHAHPQAGLLQGARDPGLSRSQPHPALCSLLGFGLMHLRSAGSQLKAGSTTHLPTGARLGAAQESTGWEGRRAGRAAASYGLILSCRQSNSYH